MDHLDLTLPCEITLFVAGLDKHVHVITTGVFYHVCASGNV